MRIQLSVAPLLAWSPPAGRSSPRQVGRRRAAGPREATSPPPVPAPGGPGQTLPFVPPRSRGTVPAPFPWRAFSCPLAPGLGWLAASALAARPALGERPPATVILDLAGSTGVTEEDCAALCWLHGRLAELGSRLWLAAVPRELAGSLGEHGVTGLLGRSAIHHSTRVAVLAAYAAVPGPGLVTSPVREALTATPEQLLPPG